MEGRGHGSELGMDLSADEIEREENNGLRAADMLLEAERLNEDALGYPLNFMFTLYYESSFASTAEELMSNKQEEIL